MSPLIGLVLGFVAMVWTALVALMAWAQMRVDPEKDGYFQLQADLGEAFRMEGWAAFQRRKGVRRAVVLLALAAFLAALAFTIWQGALLILGARG